MWSLIQSVVLKQVMSMPISFNGDLAGHLGLGQHCDVNVMQPISRIIVGNGLVAAATTCMKSVAATTITMDMPQSRCKVVSSIKAHQEPSMITKKQKSKQKEQRRHDRNAMDECTPSAGRCGTHAPQKGTGAFPPDARAILFAHGELPACSACCLQGLQDELLENS